MSIKPFGQHFLKSPEIIKRMLKTADIQKSDIVIEIGPGYGALTWELAERAKKVFAIEKDRELVSFLRDARAERAMTNVEIIEADIRDVSPSDILPPDAAYALVGNIPYYITGFLFRKFLEHEKQKPRIIVFMVQKEVAERIVSREPRHSLLSVSVQAYGTPNIIMPVSRSLFSPLPNVDSAVLAVSDISHNRFQKSEISEKRFFTILRAGFSHPRKLLMSNLSDALTIPRENVLRVFRDFNIKKDARASELSVEQWFELANKLVSK